MNPYQEKNYKIKKPRDLRLLEIKSEDIKAVERLIQMIKRNNIMFFIVCPFILLILSAGLFDAIKKSQQFDIVIRCAALIILFTYFIIVIRKVVGAKLDNIVGAQYATIKRVYTEKAGTAGDTGRKAKYYADVILTEEHSSIERIYFFGLRQGYSAFNKGDSVLVISFDGKTAYIVPATN